MAGGPLSAVMSIAGAGMLPGAASVPSIGTALSVPQALTTVLDDFDSLAIIAQFSAITSAAQGVLSNSTLEDLETIGNTAFPALSNTIPGAYASDLSVLTENNAGAFATGFTGLISTMATNILGDGDLTKFAQIYNSAEGFVAQSNQLVNSSLNVTDLSATFSTLTGGMDNLITGSFNQVTQAFGAFGSDMSRLGVLIDMNNLDNLGSPSALVGQLVRVGGLVPGVESALRVAGLTNSQIASLAAGAAPNFTGTVNKALYQGLTKVTGSDLAQVKSLLGVTTPNINTMADLLDPAKIFPNSYKTLTTPTPDGLRGIYTASGSVNTDIEKYVIGPALI